VLFPAQTLAQWPASVGRSLRTHPRSAAEGDWAQCEVADRPLCRPSPPFIVGEDEEVLYIRKATKNNLHERVWNHIQTPKDGDKEKIMTFPSNRFKVETERKCGNIVEDGEVKLGIVQIYPDRAVSVAEVYLQTICLPPLCKQIG